MKKFLTVLLTVILIAISTTTNAQTINRLHQQEISVSYSQISFPQTIYVIGEVFGIIFSLGNFEPEDTMFIGQFGVEYTNWLGKYVSLGGLITTDYMTSVVNGGESPNYTMFVISAMPIFKASWFNYKHVGMYSKIGVGISDFLDNETTHQITPAFQLSPICVDFGVEDFRGFVELGYGVQGICAGIKYIY